MRELLFGCVADDFTGASDAASFFLAGGLKTLLLNGIPSGPRDLPDGIQAIVIALKSRTQESSIAVRDSLEAFAVLKKIGCRQLYFKYCSTFDSTPEGNIGPVIDAVLEKYKLPYTIICPALPVNKRTVKNGHLFVNGVPLHKSPMKDHPLTPMWDSDLNNLIAAQGKYRSFNLDYRLLEKNRIEIFEKIFNFRTSIGNSPFYIITDYFHEKHAVIIADLFRNHPFLTGGSGLPYALARQNAPKNKAALKNNLTGGTEGRTLLLAGSCSTATRGQIANFRKNKGVSIELDLSRLLKGEIGSSFYSDFVKANKGSDVLIHTPAEIRDNGPDISELLENTLASIAYDAVESGIRKIVTAGGETSGAVARKLGFNSYLIAGSVAPGVPVLIPVDKDDMRIVYKSGNFGQEDFFARAVKAAAGI